MMKTFLLALIILSICILLMCVKILFKKGGRFPNTHIEGNPELRKKGICCARTQHKKDNERKNLSELLQEINRQ